MRRGRVVRASLGALVAAVALAHGARAQAPAEAHRATFEGTWHLVQSETEGRRVIHRAIERAVTAMNFFVQSIARARLREGTQLNRSIELRFVGDHDLRVQFDRRDTYTTRIGATQRRRGEDGKMMRVTQRFDGEGRLEQVFETDRGTRWYVYAPLQDGAMRVASTTSSPRMPAPVHFVLEYRRR